MGEKPDIVMAVYDLKLQTVTLRTEKRTWKESLIFSSGSTLVYRKLNVLAKVLYLATVLQMIPRLQFL